MHESVLRPKDGGELQKGIVGSSGHGTGAYGKNEYVNLKGCMLSSTTFISKKVKHVGREVCVHRPKGTTIPGSKKGRLICTEKGIGKAFISSVDNRGVTGG